MKNLNYGNQAADRLLIRPLLIILSGPSGVGKDAILSRMEELECPLKFITTVTTRPQRANEIDKIDYHFITRDNFQQMIATGELLEWANVYGNWYGVPREPVRDALNEGQDTIVKVDIQGAVAIKKIAPRALFIFLTTPTIEELINRLKERRTESYFDLALRIKTAREEINQLPLFDFIVMNNHGKIDTAVSDIRAIITAEKCRVDYQRIFL